MQRLRPLNEVECYLRCYGWRGSEETVKVLRKAEVAPNRKRGFLGERIRLLFEDRLDAREPDAD